MTLKYVDTYTGTSQTITRGNAVTITCSNSISGTNWGTPTISVTFTKQVVGLPTHGGQARGMLSAVVNSSGATVGVHNFTATANMSATEVTASITNSNANISNIRFINHSDGNGQVAFVIKKIVITTTHTNTTVTAGNKIDNANQTAAGLPSGSMVPEGIAIKKSNAMGTVSVSGLSSAIAYASEWNSAVATNNISHTF